MKIINQLSQELNIEAENIKATIDLIDEGNTIPFISRYRKEITGNLDDGQLRNLNDRLTALRNLEKRKEDVIRLIDEQEKLTKELEKSIWAAQTLTEVDDLYLPYRKGRKTRADIAKEKGAEPLAELIWNLADLEEINKIAESLISEENEIKNREEALQLASDINAQKVSETIIFRDMVRREGRRRGSIISQTIEEKEDQVYKMYFDYEEQIKNLRAHNILALFRGEKEGALRLRFNLNDETNISNILLNISQDEENPVYPFIEASVQDGYKRLLLPSIETEIKNSLKEMAEEESIDVFAGNLRPYLMQSPIKGRAIIGLDPGIRTGCKVAVINEFGSFLEDGLIFVAGGQKNEERASTVLKNLIEKHNVKLIAIGNGTASRETEAFVARFLEKEGFKDISFAIVNEAGASVYSASKIAEDEFPDLDVSIRGAISIARRIQDPLAELVKIEPQHIGIGQYQHDINQRRLKDSLEEVVESCVNAVGVDVNTASAPLLSYIAGISKNMAENILKHKEEQGPFSKRKELQDVKGLGPKTFEQAAGFIRIPESEEILDNTGVHPESYHIAKKIIDEDLDEINIKIKAKELDVGELTLKDIIEELKRPGRDPREDMEAPILRSDVLSIDDIEEGMILKGTIRNVVDFGAFVDIGLGNDGLIHISEISNSFVKHPSDLLEVSQIVDVKIISIDKKNERIGLSMKGLEKVK